MTPLTDLIKNVRVCALGLFLLTLLWFAPVVKYSFVTYDDPRYVTKEEHLKNGITKDSVVWALKGPHHSMWHPVTSLSHLVDVQLFGFNPAFHHAGNVVIHAVNVVLLYLWLLVLFRTPGRALLVAMIFAWHPLRVESVAWVSERKDVLCTCFWLLTLHAYTRFARLPSGKHYAWLIAAYALGVMSKPIIVMLPIVLFLLDFWPLNRLGIREREEGDGWEIDRQMLWQRFREKIPLFALSLFLAAITYKAQHEGNVLGLMSQTSIGQRLGNAVISYIRYLGLLVWPTDLSVLYPYAPNWPVGKVITALLLLAGITFLCWRARREQPWWLVAWGWFLITLIPVIGLVQAGEAAIANRYTYCSTIGLVIAAVWSLAEFARRSEAIQRYAMISSGVVVAALITLTTFELPTWRNTETLFVKAIISTRNNPIAHLALGNFYLENGRTEEAMNQFQAGLAINPNDAKFYLSAGRALLELGQLDEAVLSLRTALKLNPKLDEAAFELSRVLRRGGKLAEAQAILQKYLELHPENSNAWNNLGTIQASQGNLTGAEQSFKNAVSAKPDLMDAWRNLVRLMAVSNRIPQALGMAEQGLTIKPDDAELWFQAGLLHEQIGKPDFARKNYEMALKYRMYWELPSEALAWLLIQQPTIPEHDLKTAKALVDAMLVRNKAKGIPPHWVELNACVLAAAGEFPTAIEKAQLAKQGFQQMNDSKGVARVDAQIAAFKQRKSWKTVQVSR